MKEKYLKSAIRIFLPVAAALVIIFFGLRHVAPIPMRLAMELTISERIQSMKNVPAIWYFKQQLKGTKRIDFTENVGRTALFSISDPREIQRILSGISFATAVPCMSILEHEVEFVGENGSVKANFDDHMLHMYGGRYSGLFQTPRELYSLAKSAQKSGTKSPPPN